MTLGRPVAAAAPPSLAGGVGVKVVVTGGCGFIGRHVVAALQAAGHAVCVVDDLSSGHAQALPAGVPLERLDVAGPELAAAIRRLAPDAVLHLAARAAASATGPAAVEAARVNVLGTVQLLEACRAAGVRKLVFTSSAAVYGSHPAGTPPLPETAAASPGNPYGASKLAGEVYVRCYADTGGPACTVLRLANVYGEGQRTDLEGGVVARFCAAAAEGRPGTVYGDGRQARDFVHVADVARAFVLALHRADGRTLNVATGRTVRIRKLYALCGGPEPHWAAARPGDIPWSCLDPAQAAAALGWRPRVDLEAGLAELLGRSPRA